MNSRGSVLVLVVQLVLLGASVTFGSTECPNLDLERQLSFKTEQLTEEAGGRTRIFGHQLLGDHSQLQAYASARHIQMDMRFFNAPFVSSKSEDDEYYQLRPGAFSGTSKLLGLPSGNLGHLPEKVLKSYVHVEELTCSTVVRHPVLFVERFEYANLYHTMTDFVNAFLALQQNSLSPTDVQVILFDHHGAGALDSVWHDVYSPRRPVIRPESFRSAPGGVCFDHAIFVLAGYGSPIYSKSWDNASPCRSASLPIAFSRFFYEQYGLQLRQEADPTDADEEGAETSRVLELTLVLRNDYIAHPRNPSGRVVRKWANNDALIGALQKLCRDQLSCHVSAVDFAVMDFPSQMRQIAKTDILVGVHGAGLAHAIFLQKGSQLVEVGSSFKIFQDFARWTGSQATLIFGHLGVTVDPPGQLYSSIAAAVHRILQWDKLADLDFKIQRHLASFAVEAEHPLKASLASPLILGLGAFIVVVLLGLILIIRASGPLRCSKHEAACTCPH